MSVESASYLHELDATLPTGADQRSQGDDHLRLIKSAVKGTFAAFTGPLTVSQTELNHLSGLSSNLVSQLALKAPLASPALTGIPTAPTAATLTNTSQIASCAFVQAQKDSPAFTGSPTAPTPAAGSNGPAIATTEFVQTAFVLATGGVSRAKAYFFGSF